MKSDINEILRDQTVSGISNCCHARVYLPDICSECKEHCDVEIVSVDGLSGVLESGVISVLSETAENASKDRSEGTTDGDLTRCELCGSVTYPQRDNSGWTEPQGPSHWEISGYKCQNCGHEQVDC